MIHQKIRLKEPLRAAIERDAKARGVTMQAVIVDRLERSFNLQMPSDLSRYVLSSLSKGELL